MTPSRVTVIGADSPLGEAVLREVLVRGLEVTASATRPERVARISPSLRVLRADHLVQDELRTTVEGADAVVLGLTPALGAEPTMERTNTTIALVRAMRQAGVRRLVAASHIDVDGPRSGAAALRGLLGPVRERRWNGGLADLRRMEMLLDRSGLSTAVLRAGRLVDLLGTGVYRLVAPEEATGGRLPREDLARALVDQALASDAVTGVRAVTRAPDF